MTLISSSRPFIRKKAILTMYKVSCRRVVRSAAKAAVRYPTLAAELLVHCTVE